MKQEQAFAGVVKKYNFDFAKKRDLNTVPNGEVAADIAKMFAKFFLQKWFFKLKNTIFAEIRSADREIPYTLL
jgi:hypothetical protein